ncbi:winged helix-turn-helix domain-containing protein [Halomontanus rarus]|uniref:winged helix-turn-helix domain-containing protein n=1 Tax=Halomontanus rarus TaxID=3034020 RepID=UPI001A98F02A
MDDVPRSVSVLAELFAGLGNANRLATLLGLYRGESVAAIADTVPITEQGVRQHADRLVEAGLVYRPETADELYAVTPLGVFFAVFVEEHQDAVLRVVDAVDEAEEQARAEYEEAPLAEETRERVVTERKWALVEEELADELQQLQEAARQSETDEN